MPSDRTGHSELPRVSRPPPVCYSCGVPGHISRFCNNPPTYQRDPLLMSPQPLDRPFPTPRQPRTPTSLRYPSPASDRNFTPPPAPCARRSPSPRRRMKSPPPENQSARPMGNPLRRWLHLLMLQARMDISVLKVQPIHNIYK
ncbi:uncharacterized protein LOC125939814 [Dermacentor silvarum]|uniref:uncharacterized protein LOC125939814 n=1 Tax=Dermacentor silvarum TaxID=543639 RepID=UPI00210136B0|nr:uncharacterized protein LOC125939814 [Dermacentor silvarum]